MYGPSGSGKSELINHILQKHACKAVIELRTTSSEQDGSKVVGQILPQIAIKVVDVRIKYSNSLSTWIDVFGFNNMNITNQLSKVDRHKIARSSHL